MRMEKMTNQLQQALGEAQSLALGKDHNLIEPEHLLAALIDQSGGASRPLLLKAGVKIDELSADLATAIQSLPTIAATNGDVHMSPDLGRILNVTDKMTQQAGDTYISSERVLQAMIDSNSVVANLLKARWS